MAIMRQYSGLTGRRVKPSYVEAINAQTPYLTSLYSAKESADYQDKMLDLEEQRLAQEEELANESLALSEESLKEQEKQNQRANLYSGLNLGTNLGLGYMKYRASDPESIYADAGASNLAKAADTDTLQTSLTDYGEQALADTTKDTNSFLSGLTDTSNWADALTNLKTYATGLGAGTAGAALGRELFGDNDLTGVLSGAATAGLTEYLTGGDLYSSIASSLLGGGMGLF